MTLDEILSGLEGLKDFVNDHQKPHIDALKAGVKALVEKVEPPVVQEAEVVESKPEVPQEEVKEESKEDFAPKNVVKRKPYKRRSSK